MDINQRKELRRLIEAVMYSSTKKEAQTHTNRLEFVSSQLRSNLDGYVAGKLKKVVNYAKKASGQVSNKEHWISMVEQSWNVFETEIERKKSEI
jgi:hypothetical protein